jgi:hypothetical protein
MIPPRAFLLSPFSVWLIQTPLGPCRKKQIIEKNMLTLRYYSTPREYLAAAENHLLSAELQNNLPLGICYSLLDSNRDLSSCLFASACDDQKIVATTISTVGKAILSTSADMPRSAVQVLAEAYKQKI